MLPFRSKLRLGFIALSLLIASFVITPPAFSQFTDNCYFCYQVSAMMGWCTLADQQDGRMACDTTIIPFTMSRLCTISGDYCYGLIVRDVPHDA